MTKVTAEQLKEVWNLPGCRFRRSNHEGGYCAAGKMSLLGVYIYSPSIVRINDKLGFFENIKLQLGYPISLQSFTVKSNPKLWNQHIRAFKIAIQNAIRCGSMTLEDEAAAEFARLQLAGRMDLTPEAAEAA